MMMGTPYCSCCSKGIAGTASSVFDSAFVLILFVVSALMVTPDRPGPMSIGMALLGVSGLLIVRAFCTISVKSLSRYHLARGLTAVFSALIIASIIPYMSQGGIVLAALWGTFGSYLLCMSGFSLLQYGKRYRAVRTAARERRKKTLLRELRESIDSLGK